MDTFPSDLLRPKSIQYPLLGVEADGGPALVGPGQAAELSGGGWWGANYDPGTISKPRLIRLLRAMLMRMRGGVEIIMPFVDEPQAPWVDGVFGRAVATPFSDGATFSDGTRFQQGLISFQLAEAIAENAGEAILTRVQGADLTGGEIFTLVHADAGPRVYCIDDVEQIGTDTFAIGFGPPARQGAVIAADADFQNPRCVMRQLGSAEAWPTITTGWRASSSLKFVESFDYLLED